MAKVVKGSIAEALNTSQFSLFHIKAMFASAMGFFTSAYDLFIIGTALVLIKDEWHLSAQQVGLIGSISLIATFFGAFIFGNLADRLGRKSVYGIEAILMVLGALMSAFSFNVGFLLLSRFILGLGVGGDYPLSAVIMSEYANTTTRGRMVTLVFSAQALGLIAGPMVALTLLAAGVDKDLAWRIMLGLGALPAATVIYLRRRLPESPRWLARVKGEKEVAAKDLASFSLGDIVIEEVKDQIVKKPLSKYWLQLLGTAGTWFLFDYAYYGNTISTPLVLKHIATHANLIQSTAISFLIFVVFAVPGYFIAAATIDKIGHKFLQMLGFFMMGLMFFIIGMFPSIVHNFPLFVTLYGLSYFFAEFGPNTTTFVLPAEVFPVNVRTTAHGISAGVAKIGAFIGAYFFPILLKSLGLSHTLLLTFVFSLAGLILTYIAIPEPKGKSLEEVSQEDTTLSKPSPAT
ncbi:General substrate transporter [Hydrogenobaculum sp. Y04AAS1]|uniref:MFS transporter n=1 Tax=Hydrogenobaculum sp. (strain Y04AAS1) TaxID=380749 RepID=UPI00015BCCED|nr:General substrate transporter [Hydrogenobaculum sp. Y04AAS1]